MKKILGIKIRRNRSERTLFLNQSAYIEKMLSDLKMEQDSHRPVKLPINGYDTLVPASYDNGRVDPRIYQQFIGSITYVITVIRPDIIFATNKLAQFISDPTDYHLSSAKHLTRYLRLTKDIEI